MSMLNAHYSKVNAEAQQTVHLWHLQSLIVMDTKSKCNQTFRRICKFWTTMVVQQCSDCLTPCQDPPPG